MAHKAFRLVHAQAAIAIDGTEVEFTGRHTLDYRTPARSIVLPVETYIAADGAPDGVIVDGAPTLTWSDGTRLTQPAFAAIMADLQDAAGPLQTKFRLPQGPD